MKRYNTSIKRLVEAQRNYNLLHSKKAIFLSDWDAELETIAYPPVDNVQQLSKKVAGKYYYWTDELNYKIHFQQSYEEILHNVLEKDSFLIGNNGTSSIMLSLMALKELGIRKILAFTPIYFSTINLFDLLEYQMYRFDLQLNNDFQIDIDLLESEIKRNNIEAIFITDPIFSSGVEISSKVYTQISCLCKKYNVWTIVDYIYGGMSWNSNNYIISDKIDHILHNFDHYILIESISKRLFINGIKTATVFSEPQIIRKILRLSVCTVGSMCCLQLQTLKAIYNKQNADAINKVIRENVNETSRRFNRILSLFDGKNCIISTCNCSYFFLLGIPNLDKIDDTDYAINLLNQIGVLTVPHSRYLLSYNKYYVFRVNLLINENDLYDGLFKISNLI